MTLSELQALCDAATPGPWHYETCYGVATITANGEGIAHAVEYVPRPNADLIAAARTYMPLLLKVASYAKSLLSEEGVFESISHFNAAFGLKEAIEELEKP